MLQRIDQHLNRTGNLALGVGILHAQKQDTAGLVRHALGNESLHQIAQMDKAGGGGRHAGDDRAFGKAAGRIALLQLLRRFGHLREKELCKPCCIHRNYL